MSERCKKQQPLQPFTLRADQVWATYGLSADFLRKHPEIPRYRARHRTVLTGDQTSKNSWSAAASPNSARGRGAVMRVHRLRDRTPKEPPFRIDTVLPGSRFASGGKRDRFRCQCETRSAKLHAQRCQMIVDLWQRGRRDVLEARLADRFTTDELHIAYKRGAQALEELLQRTAPTQAAAPTAPESLETAIDEYLAFNLKMRDAEKPRVRVMLMRFAEWVGTQGTSGAEPRVATVHDLTSANVLSFLSQLTSRHHYKDRPVSPATRNRYRTALGGLASRLVKRKLVADHFIRDGGLAKFTEGGARLPTWTPAEREAYFAAIRELRPEFLPAFYLLANTGADISEVLSRRVRDVHFGNRLTRIDYRRTKTDTLPRLVPLHSEYADALREHIGTRLGSATFCSACSAGTRSRTRTSEHEQR